MSKNRLYESWVLRIHAITSFCMCVVYIIFFFMDDFGLLMEIYEMPLHLLVFCISCITRRHIGLKCLRCIP